MDHKFAQTENNMNSVLSRFHKNVFDSHQLRLLAEERSHNDLVSLS